MENKLYDKNSITLDGRLDEPVWATAKEYSEFKTSKAQNRQPCPVRTTFKILTFEDRIFIGVKCMEPEMKTVLEQHVFWSLWTSDAIEMFFSPSGNSFEFYQFIVTVGNQTGCNFYSEGGQIQPDPYAPDWKSAVYHGDDYWSMEVEIPLAAFYMTANDAWSGKWLVNICRDQRDIKAHTCRYYTWSDLDKGYLQSTHYRMLDGFPMRPARNDLRIVQATVDITEENEDGLCGTMTVKTVNPEAAEFEFVSDATEPMTIALEAGANEFTVPCCFPKRGRHKTSLQLKRLEDGMVFKRYYPVLVEYEAIRLQFTLPEYRNNFYPGQDCTKISGTVTAGKPITLTLEGPGIPKQVLTPNADGSFVFETPGFEVGDAFLTATIEGYEIVKKIRRLAPSGHMMTWISGGNLIVDSEPVLRRNMYAEYYHGGEAFQRRYDADDLHQTKKICCQVERMQPDGILSGKGLPIGEVTQDVKPHEEVFKAIDAVLDANKDREFAYYYLSDEPECRNLSPIYLKHLYDYIADKDPYHVVLMASRSADRYLVCSDWIETHPYLNAQQDEERGRYYGRSIASMGDCLDCVAKLNRPDKCIGFLPTCFAYKWNNIYSDYPNFDEMICHTWAAMLPGGKTLWPYAYHDLNDRASLYEGMRYVFSSFEALDQLVLFGHRTDLVKNQNVHAVLYDKGDEKMFVLANMTQKPQKVTLEGISGEWHEFRHNRLITGNTFELKPLEVVIGTSDVKDAGLPTYEETAALIDKLEYERTHTGSLLFDRYRDIEITASVPTSKYKLFDGVRDNYAWECSSKDGSFMELDLTKVKPTFTKVVVYGFQIDDMTIKVRNNSELSVPAIKEKTTEEFSTTFILAEPICPDALRLEFGERRVELYEIEAF